MISTVPATLVLCAAIVATAALGGTYGVAISAVRTSLSLLSAFKDTINLPTHLYDVGEPVVLAGIIAGSMLPYLFAALTMISVGKAAAEIITEVRDQFANLKNEHGTTLGECIRMHTDMAEGKIQSVPKTKEVKPNP